MIVQGGDATTLVIEAHLANGSVTFNLPRHLLTRNEDETFSAPHEKAASIMS
jgi:hypothetical protein